MFCWVGLVLNYVTVILLHYCNTVTTIIFLENYALLGWFCVKVSYHNTIVILLLIWQGKLCFVMLLLHQTVLPEEYRTIGFNLGWKVICC